VWFFVNYTRDERFGLPFWTNPGQKHSECGINSGSYACKRGRYERFVRVRESMMPAVARNPLAIPQETQALTAHTGETLSRVLGSTTFRLGLVTFWSNFALLVLQQVSFRLLAPAIGSSIETWSTIVGVFLVGIAAGNAVGGRLADRVNGLRTVRWSLLAACAAALWMLGLSEVLKSATWMAAWPLAAQVVCIAIAVCFPPAFLLSLPNPAAIRGVMNSGRGAGAAAGLVCALGTVGSLVGNYATGFWMIPEFAIGNIVLLVATGLWCLALAAPTTAATSTTSSAKSSDSRLFVDAPLAQRAVLAVAIVASCGFVSGAIESAAFRILAPLAGVSIYLSTGVVGVVLCGMALGNHWGGRLAERGRGLSTLRGTLGLAALATVLVVPLLKNGLDLGAFDGWPLVPRIVGWSFLLFFLPSLLLGMVSPQVIRLAIADRRDAGRIAGWLYAWSTVGCVVGILATAWFLVEWWGVQRLVMACGFALAPLAWACRPVSIATERRLPWPALVGGLAALALLANLRSPYALETRYFSIAVLDGERDGRQVKRLVLDRLVHSEVDLADPTWLGYPHEETQAEITRNLARREAAAGRALDLLVIGGGGYTFPKWIEHQPDLAQVGVDVVEIDPGVTEIAHRELGLSRETRIRSFNLDGRQFVKQAPNGRYGLIVQDAVNDFSVPYHLMTREYNDLVRSALTEEGVYLLTVIDSIRGGKLLPAALRTMRASFGDVRLLVLRDPGERSSRGLYILAGLNTRADASGPAREVAWEEVLGATRDRLMEVDPSLLDGPILTDAYAPVDSLMAGNYLGAE
jgi:hypothetical protein